MGYEITRNEKGRYVVKSSNSGERYHRGSITVNQVKKILIEDALSNFIDKVIEIDMQFPTEYRINDEPPAHYRGEPRNLYSTWYCENMMKPNFGDIRQDKFEEINKRLKLGLDDI